MPTTICQPLVGVLQRYTAVQPGFCLGATAPADDDDPGPSMEHSSESSSDHGTSTGSHKNYYVFNHLVLNVLVVQMHEGHAHAADLQVPPPLRHLG